jgi:hypothetical protein
MEARLRCRQPDAVVWRRRTAAVAIALLLLLAVDACSPTETTAPLPGSLRTALLVRADLSGTAVATVTVEVTAPDITTPLVFNLTITGDLALGTVTVPAGSARTITMQAFDAGGVETHSGSVTVSIQTGTNPPIAIVLQPLSGDVPINATLGSFAVSVSPDVRGLVLGDTMTLTATVLDAQGAPVAAQVVWASFAPNVATVVSTGPQTGRVTGLGVGQTKVIVAFGGTAAPATIEVYTSPDSSWTHEPVGLIGLSDKAADRDYDFVLQNVDGSIPTASGWFNPYPGDFADGQVSIITDSTAPFPNNVVQVTYPIGWNIGAAPGEVDFEFPRSVTEFYVGFYFKISNPYQSDASGHNKIAYLYTPVRGVVLEFAPEGDHWKFFMADYISNPDVEVDHFGATPISGDVWYKIELSMSYSNSRVQWWVNGAPDQDFACDLTDNSGGGLYRLEFSPTYGGGGSPTKTEVDHVWYDHVHIGGLP